MPILSNARHESFAQALAKGKTADEAYAQAGYRPHRSNASRMSANDNVRARVAEIQSKAAKRAEVTIESLADELDEARALALGEKQASAAIAATMGKAKLYGKLVDKHRHSGHIGTYDLTKLSEDELDRLESILGPLALAGGDQSGEGEAQG